MLARRQRKEILHAQTGHPGEEFGENLGELGVAVDNLVKMVKCHA